MLLTLRGTPFLYYGDELALPDVPLDAETALDPVARRTGDAARQPRRLPHADAVGGRARRRVHDRGCDAVAAVRRPRGLQRRRAARGPGLGAAPRARPDRAAQAARRADHRLLRDAARAGGGMGVATRRALRRRAEPVRRRGRGRGRRRAAWRSATDRARDGEAVAGARPAAAVRGRRRRAATCDRRRAGDARGDVPGWRRCCRTRAGRTRRCRRRSRATRGASTPSSAATR